MKLKPQSRSSLVQFILEYVKQFFNFIQFFHLHLIGCLQSKLITVVHIWGCSLHRATPLKIQKYPLRENIFKFMYVHICVMHE